ncbi:hypothetical protein EVAR_89694_1 [Eumeta japonica]|uniref:Uncharacterized protein n=1 Tax=Eumeta variegata TaxID=151549 RepID=A0A4C1WYC8_EUMVA|nr:hypothetical protein EVAR_89694_1 [Eumeta japonica]
MVIRRESLERANKDSSSEPHRVQPVVPKRRPSHAGRVYRAGGQGATGTAARRGARSPAARYASANVAPERSTRSARGELRRTAAE